MRILGVDYGDFRTGLALSDTNGILASGIGSVEQSDIKKTAEAVAEIARKNGAELIVVGYPRNMNGTVGERAIKTEHFADLLREASGIEVVLFDERRTTLAAAAYLNQTNTRGRKRKKVIDTLAASIMLQNYLDSRR